MLDKLFDGKSFDTAPSPRMPVLFIGHGSPMNAIDKNSYTRTLNELGQRLQRPKSILVISAHWMSEGSWVTAVEKPKTIHDFYGFPQELFDVQYPAPGSPELANLMIDTIQDPNVYGDKEMWGLDHGTWSVLRHLYPEADIPVVQLSIYMEQPPEYHVKLGQQLSFLREKGVLILGSGNLVHNLRCIRWGSEAKPYDWAIEYDEWLKKKLEERDFHSLLHNFHQTEAGRLSIPSMDHYYPLHYVLGASDKKDELRFEYEEMQNGSISMRSFSLGLP